MNKLRDKIQTKYGVLYSTDALFKARKNPSGAGKKLSKFLEGVTGVPRLQFLYPEEYAVGDPWEEANK